MTLAVDKRGQLVAAKRHKYAATATVLDGIRFASKLEAECYQALRLLVKSGGITELERQPKFQFPMGFAYVADFKVTWNDGREEVIDAKGVETQAFRLKKKCMAYFYPNVKLSIWKRGDVRFA